MPVDERTFAADAASWMTAILARRTDLPYSRASVEEHTPGANTRRDITLYSRHGTKIALMGEIKVPDKIYGQNPYDLELVRNAQDKANNAGITYFFTWNVNRFVLWRTFIPGVLLLGRSIEEVPVVTITSSDELRQSEVEGKIKEFLESFLERFARIERGEAALGQRPLDEGFISALENALIGPIYGTLDAITARYRTDTAFRAQLDAWMRDDQGWLLSDDSTEQRNNLERAAKLSCYVLVNKIVFAEALRRRFPALLPMQATRFSANGAIFRQGMTGYFQKAMQVSRDYKSVFSKDFGDTLPFESDDAVSEWVRLTEQIAEFDFTALGYDVIGRIFERLIEPEERHKYGQHYTRPNLVDLINAFCIRSADAVVLDPACGGGTFLVRAYARKRELAARAGDLRPHHHLLAELYGADISAFAAHLSTINLATRDLVDSANYPRIAHRDFFAIEPDTAAFTVPGLGTGQPQHLKLPTTLDAVVGNPPYIRQENIGAAQKGRIRELIGRDYRDTEAMLRPDPAGRSDIHIYFWLHAARFLREGGYFGFLTSSTWLDVEYGFPLQHWLLNNFRIVAVLESETEPWFTEARVITCATILQKEPDAHKRAENPVRFVQFAAPLSQIIPETGNEAIRQAAVEKFVRQIEGYSEDTQTAEYRVRVVPQRELWQEGASLYIRNVGGAAADSAETDDDEDSETDADAPEPVVALPGGFVGSKWGIHLRAPEMYFALRQRVGPRLVPVEELATVRFGIKSGKDRFFYLKDITDAELARLTPEQFTKDWGITPTQTRTVRVMKAGDGSAHPIERKYLLPELHRLAEVHSPVVTVKDTTHFAFNVNALPEELHGTLAAKYVRYGERENYHTGSTIAARARSRPWYVLAPLSPNARAQMFWSKAHQYRHIVAWNENKIVCNNNLYDVWAKHEGTAELLWAVLNSTLVGFMKLLYGRPVGREANLKTEIVDVLMMPVPDPRHATDAVRDRLLAAIRAMAALSSAPLHEELARPERQALDDAVFELLGLADANERAEWRERLYAEVHGWYEKARALEVEAMRNRNKATRRGAVTPMSIANELWEAFDTTTLRSFPDAFVPSGAATMPLTLLSGPVHVNENASLFDGATIRIGGRNGTTLPVPSVAHGRFLRILNEHGRNGELPIPEDTTVCTNAVSAYGTYHTALKATFEGLAESRTSDAATCKKIVAALFQKAIHHHD